MQKLRNVDSQPLITIIIPVYNAECWLASAIQSVNTQQLSNIQLIIIDGGSTDSSLQIIDQYMSSIDLVVSESDNGIYDAMNKGIDRATGEWIYFLGADDQLEDDVLKQIVPFLKNPFVVVYGSVRFNNGQQLISNFTPRIIFQNTVHHQGAFYHHSLFKSFRYDIELKIISDYELNLQVFLQRLPTYRLPFFIALCRADGASSNISLSLEETNKIRSRHVAPWRSWLLTKLLHVYYWQKYTAVPNFLSLFYERG